MREYLSLPANPDVVLVDTEIIAKAPADFLFPVWVMLLLLILKQKHVRKQTQQVVQVEK